MGLAYLTEMMNFCNYYLIIDEISRDEETSNSCSQCNQEHEEGDSMHPNDEISSKELVKMESPSQSLSRRSEDQDRDC
jgi:hypothetical protein